ncbi:M14 family zinc carboxypeptidase [Amycolatopsis sp. NPDC059027]|uniref:M14 family zinc carboxypeptidase n=1 Tax=Amycolatopsis sp. NPDC059027 TaxID=3346709 RepID=UPI00367095E6
MTHKPRIALLAALTGAALLVAPATALATVDTPADAVAAVTAVDPRPDTARLAAELRELTRRSHGEIRLAEIGRTNEHRPVWAARVGHGAVRVQYVTQQHGDEPLGTPAALEFLRHAGVGHSAWQRWLLSRVTVDIVVRANPDGHEHDWRYNYDPAATPEFGERGKGYDINRYHNPSLDPARNPATEAGLIQRRYTAFDPDIVVDYHMQGRYQDDKGRAITASAMWPTHPATRPSEVDFAKQITVVAKRSIEAVGGNVSQYPGGDYEGIARNAYGLRGSGSVLIELSDQGAAYEQKQIRSALASMLAIAGTAADGSLRHIDPAQADAIPPRGKPIPSTLRASEPALD